MKEISPIFAIGPFTQIVTLRAVPLKGAIQDEALEIIPAGGIVVEGGKLKAIGSFDNIEREAETANIPIHKITSPTVLLPGFIDAHTHICFDGSRAKDYAMRAAGKSYLEIANAGGGIWDTVLKTREASLATLVRRTQMRAHQQLLGGVTTVEVKSGYGLSLEEELKMLRAIQEANEHTAADLIPTCLPAHILPKDFEGQTKDYIEYLLQAFFPLVKQEKLSHRADIFVEEGAFSVEDAQFYMTELRKMGFDLTVHADQFSTGGSQVAIECGAKSADHLEASGEIEIKALAGSEVIPVALPGASVGLGCDFAPGRRLLDAGASLAIASDWNPGSAPMGDLLTLASIYGMFEKLSTAEVLAGISIRAAAALGLSDRGCLSEGNLADMIAFETADYREIFYRQGRLRPKWVWKEGKRERMECF